MAQIDEIVGGIYRIAVPPAEARITFNQFLIDDERPALIHTGNYGDYEQIRQAVGEVIDPAKLAYVILLHWEGDENGGMDRFMAEAKGSELVGSELSIVLNAYNFGVVDRVRGFRDGETLELGSHTLRFLETPHVHHWDSMMLFEETTRSLFPSDLFLQPGDVPAVVNEDLTQGMLETYREAGIFAHEEPIRQVVDRIEALAPDWIHAMHGGTLTGEIAPRYYRALREESFAYRGKLLGREVHEATHA